LARADERAWAPLAPATRTLATTHTRRDPHIYNHPTIICLSKTCA